MFEYYEDGVNYILSRRNKTLCWHLFQHSILNHTPTSPFRKESTVLSNKLSETGSMH